MPNPKYTTEFNVVKSYEFHVNENIHMLKHKCNLKYKNEKVSKEHKAFQLLNSVLMFYPMVINGVILQKFEGI